MAQGLRSRPIAAAAAAPLAWLTLLAACGEQRAQPQAPPQPRAVDVASLPADELVEAVLDECHRPLRERMRRVSATVVRGERRDAVFAELPDRVRVHNDAGRFLLRDGEVHRLDERPLDDADAARVRLLAFAIDACAFGALQRATDCARVGEHEFELTDERGATWRLELRRGTLLPAALTCGDRHAAFVDYRRTPGAWVAQTVDVRGLGRCAVTFEDGGIQWSDDFFALPDARQRGGAVRITAPGAVVEAKNATPARKPRAATRYVVLPDPGDWPARAAAYKPVYDELLRQRQKIAGFPLFWRQDGAAWLGAPFRQRDGGPPLDAPADWTIRDLPDGFELKVFPDAGDLAARTEAGERALRAELARRGLEPRGPITSQPWLHLHRGPPTADDLAATTVSVAVAIE